MDKAEAQRRADRIRAFREELESLEEEGVLVLTEEQCGELSRHQETTLQDLAQRFDIDTTAGEKQLSWGMRIASFLAALALGAAVFLLFYRFWGALSTPAQVGVLVLAPILGVAAMAMVARRERTLYFTSLLGVVAFACFVLDLSVLGSIFNVTPTQNAFLVWGAFAMLLAYAYGLRLLLAAGILFLGAWLPASIASWSGWHWPAFGARPENFLPAALALFLLPLVVPHRRHAGFGPVYRFFGLLGVLVPVLILSQWGRGSYLMLPEEGIEIAYELLGFLLSGAAVWIGIRMAWKETANLGVVSLVVFLYIRLFAWWWDWMPKYLFFFILAAIAVGILLVMMKVRSRGREARP